MIEIETRLLSEHEIIHAFPAGKGEQPLPTVVFYHGFLSSKLVYSYFAVALAQAGFRVVMPDAPNHGARFTGDEQARLGLFWQTLHGNLVEGERLAVAGASMGGMTALGLMARHPEVTSVACLMGSGYFMSLAKTLFPPQAPQEIEALLSEWDVSHALSQLADRPLLLWHGDADDVVPPGETFRLQQALQREGLDSNLICLWGAGVRHRITPAALEATVEFFRQHL